MIRPDRGSVVSGSASLFLESAMKNSFDFSDSASVKGQPLPRLQLYCQSTKSTNEDPAGRLPGLASCSPGSSGRTNLPQANSTAAQVTAVSSAALAVAAGHGEACLARQVRRRRL